MCIVSFKRVIATFSLNGRNELLSDYTKPKMNELDRQRIKALFPRASEDFLDANIGFGLRSETNQSTARKALERPVEGTQKGDDRIGVSYVLYRVRLLDPDAIHGATKVCTDCLQQIGLITGDGPQQITLEVTQEKVNHRNEQRTQLTLTYPR